MNLYIKQYYQNISLVMERSCVTKNKIIDEKLP